MMPIKQTLCLYLLRQIFALSEVNLKLIQAGGTEEMSLERREVAEGAGMRAGSVQIKRNFHTCGRHVLIN